MSLKVEYVAPQILKLIFYEYSLRCYVSEAVLANKSLALDT